MGWRFFFFLLSVSMPCFYTLSMSAGFFFFLLFFPSPLYLSYILSFLSSSLFFFSFLLITLFPLSLFSCFSFFLSFFLSLSLSHCDILPRTLSLSLFPFLCFCHSPSNCLSLLFISVSPLSRFFLCLGLPVCLSLSLSL